MSARLKQSSSPPLYSPPPLKRVSQWEDGAAFDDLLPILTPAKKPRTKNPPTTSPPKSSPRRTTLPRRVASSSSLPRQPATPAASPRPSSSTKSLAPRRADSEAAAQSEDEDVLVLASPAGGSASIFAPPPVPPRAHVGVVKPRSPQRPVPTPSQQAATAAETPVEPQQPSRSPALPSPALPSPTASTSHAPQRSPPPPIPSTPDISTFLSSLPLPLPHLFPTFASLGCTSSSDLLALASDTEMGRATRKVLLDLVQEESGGGSRWERVVLEEGLRVVGSRGV